MDSNIREYQKYLMMQGGGHKPATSIADYSKYFPSKGNPLLKTLLSIGGGTIGAIGGTFVGGPLGTIAGGALGSGLGTAAGRAIGGQAIGAEGGLQEIGIDTALGGLFSGGVGKLVKGGAQVGKGALQMGAKEAAAQTAKGLGTSAGVSVGKEAAQTLTQKTGKITGQQALESAQQAVVAGRPKDIFGKAALSMQRAAQKELGFQEGAQIGRKVLSTQQTDNLFSFLINKIKIKGGEKLSPGLAIRNTERFTDDIFKSLQKTAKDVKYIFSKADAEKIIAKAREAYPVTVRQNSKALKELETNIFNKIRDKEFIGVDTVRKEADAAIDYARGIGAKEPWMDQAASALRNAIDDRLVQISPVNKEVKTLFSNASDVKKLLLNAQKKEVAGPGNPFQAVLRTAQASRAALGTSPVLQKTLQTLSKANTLGGKLGAGVAPTVLSQSVRQTLGSAVSPVAQQMIFPQPQQTQDMQNMTGGMTDTTGMMGDMGGGTMGTGQDMGQQSQIDSYFQGLAMQDLQQTGGKRLAAIKAAYDLFGGGKSQKSVTQQNAERKLSQAVNTVGLLQQQFQRAGGGQGFAGYGQTLAGALKLPSADAAKSYQDNRRGFAALISKSLGESGVLTDQDIKRALANIPDITDTPGVAQTKWNNLMQVLQGGYANVGSDTRFNF